VSVFKLYGRPTYRCYNPSSSGEFRNPLPAETGLLGVLPGIAGTIMANEVIKIITGYGEVLSGKILIFNIMNNRFEIFKITANPENQMLTKLHENY
jgi:adenylyltransferase/sulfurtransferase